jgi:putative YphP/YqiW family bacilliredoxin
LPNVPYPEYLIAPMREELTQLGVEELRSAADVDQAVRNTRGTLMIVVNSVCGCAAGRARPGIADALQHATRPSRVASVFAGADEEATARARSYFTGMPPSSPSAAILRDGRLVYMLHRHQIEMRTPQEIGAELRAAFDKFCASEPVAR